MSRKRRPWKHQVTAMTYCRKEQHPALFMEMRLGKNLVTIRRIKMYKPLDAIRGLFVLIVAPSSALADWYTELELEGETDIVLLTGVKKTRQELLIEGHKWNLINKEGFLALPEIADQDIMNWDSVVVDESTFIKNPKVKVTKFFLRNFRDCPHRWILAGMPNPESDMEFWPQFAFLDGRAFEYNNFWKWRLECFEQTPWSNDWNPKPGVLSQIRRAVGRRAFILHRKDANLHNEKIYEKRIFELPKKLRKTYEEVETSFILRDYNNQELSRTQWAGQQYQWLRQICGGYVDHERVWDGKHKELLSLLRGELKGQSVVVWFNYNQELLMSEKDLNKTTISHGVLHGAMNLKARRVVYHAFQQGRIKVFLMQQAVAQMGMDLSRADTAIYFSSPTGLLARTQTEDRIAHPNKKTPLLYIDFLVGDSVDMDNHTHLKVKKIKSSMTVDRARQYCSERIQKRG